MFLDMLFVFYKLLSGDHSCQDIMSRESRPKIAPYSISSIIDEMLGNFSLSPSLPEVMDYSTNLNPLMEVLTDQIYQDPSMPNLSGNHLIKDILEALEKGAIPWPKEEFSLIECKEWSQKMKIN